MKKIISMVIVLSMIVSMIPGAAFAAEADNLCEHYAEHSQEVCGYVEGVSDCAYHCDVCLGHDHDGEETSEAVCTCGTDDAAIHATTCAVYVAPENPVCHCTEKCTEINVWCDVCGFDIFKCTGTDTAVAYEETSGLQINGYAEDSDDSEFGTISGNSITSSTSASGTSWNDSKGSGSLIFQWGNGDPLDVIVIDSNSDEIVAHESKRKT